MNFVNINNNIEPNNKTMASRYQDKVKVNTLVPMTVYENIQVTKVQYKYNLKDECCFVETYDPDWKEKEYEKVKMSGKARVVVEKLPESVVQQYLARKEKNYEKMNFGQKLSNSSLKQFVRKDKIDNCTKSSLPNGYSVKKEKFETDKFVKELCNPMMQKYLANTEMGYLTDDFEEIPDPIEYPARTDNTIDSLINNLSGDADVQYPVEMENNYQDQFIKSLTCPTVQQCNIDIPYSIMQGDNVNVEKLDDVINSSINFITQEIVSKKKNVSKRKSHSNRRRCRRNTKLCQRICLVCNKYVEKLHKVNEKVKCETCKRFTLYECNACKKLSKTYGGIADHLLYRCEACNYYKCAHCKYSVTKKRTLSGHIRRNHEKQILRHLLAKKNYKGTEKSSSKSHQGSEHNKRFENLIVLKKQKEMKCNSEWVIENVKRSDLRVNTSMDSSVLPETISNQPMQNLASLTGVESMAQLYCVHCEKEIEIDAFKTETYCRTCGTDYRFKCSKCDSTFQSYPMMKLHFKRCTSKKKNREYFYCSECNFRSIFQGLVVNHQHKIHGFDQADQFSYENLI